MNLEGGGKHNSAHNRYRRQNQTEIMRQWVHMQPFLFFFFAVVVLYYFLKVLLEYS